jgi:hypothetical protein
LGRGKVRELRPGNLQILRVAPDQKRENEYCGTWSRRLSLATLCSFQWDDVRILFMDPTWVNSSVQRADRTNFRQRSANGVHQWVSTWYRSNRRPQRRLSEAEIESLISSMEISKWCYVIPMACFVQKFLLVNFGCTITHHTQNQF